MKTRQNRAGAIVPMFALILPVLILIAMIAINIAHMQLVQTELKIATDAAARGGGRGWSESQDIDIAKDYAVQIAALNQVGGSPLVLSTTEADGQLLFGKSTQTGSGRFQFVATPETDILAGDLATGFQVNATHPASLLFRVGNMNSFGPRASSVASQVDRDIAIVVDRSGSMNLYEDEQGLYNRVTSLYNDPSNGITADEYQAATIGVNGDPAGRSYSSSIITRLNGHDRVYAETLMSDFRQGLGSPQYSRWHLLELASAEFFTVLNQSDHEEQVSVSSFSQIAEVNVPLTQDLARCQSALGNLSAAGSTAIGDGMLQAITTLNSSNQRPTAIKTIIVFTDGVNNAGTDPLVAANQITNSTPFPVVIHTVTFSSGSDQSAMQTLAASTTGSHYHADTGIELVTIFRKIASSFRTIITQ